MSKKCGDAKDLDYVRSGKMVARFWYTLCLRAAKEMWEDSPSGISPTTNMKVVRITTPSEIMDLATEHCVPYQFIASQPPMHLSVPAL